MKPILTGMIFILTLNTLFYMAQTTSNYLNPGEMSFFSFNDSFIAESDLGNYTLDNDYNGELPTSTGTVSADSTGNFFTDTFSTFTTWIKEKTGLKFVENFIGAVPSFLVAIGLPKEISFILGFLWHSLTFFIVVMWLKE